MVRGAGVVGTAVVLVGFLSSCGPPARGTVEGHVTAGPTCPVERIPPDPQCADRPVAHTVVRASSPAGRYETTTDADGFYRLVLSAGVTYTITAGASGGLPRCPQATVRISAGQTVTKDIGCDTGIR